MPTPTIIRGSEHMFNVTYEGNGGGQRVGNFVPFTDNGTIAKSVMVDHGSSSYLERTQDTVSGDDNKRKATFSCWFKPSGKRFGNETALFCAAPSGRLFARFDTSNRLVFRLTNSTTEYQIVTERTFEDSSKFYHLLWQVDASQGTAANRSRVWIDGSEITSWNSAAYPAQNTDVVGLADGTVFRISSLSHSALQFFDGYIAEFNCISGSIVDVSTFGLTDTSTGRWIPKTLTGITYGTNGFRCTFANSAGQTIGDDTSGNGNDLTLNGIGTDHITTDTPTQNFMTLDSNRNAGQVLSEGNLRTTCSAGGGTHKGLMGNMVLPKSGKYYWETKVVQNVTDYRAIGIQRETLVLTETSGNLGRSIQVRAGDTTRDGRPIASNADGSVNNVGSNSPWGAIANNTVVSWALDADKEYLYVSVGDDNWKGFDTNSSDPVAGTNPTFRDIEKTSNWRIYVQNFSDGASHIFDFNFGQKPFENTVPTGYSNIQQDNLPTTEKGITDLFWGKNRDASANHYLFDSSRGATKLLQSTTDAQSVRTDAVQKFLKGGVSLEDFGGFNTSGESFVGWNWVANGATTSANTDGSGATRASTIQANQTAGFSIVSFSSSGDSGFNTESFAHGLSQAPEWVLFKRTDSTSNWGSYHKDAYASNQHGMFLNTTAANAVINAETTFFPVAPTNSIFSYTNRSATAASADFIAYCWHSVEGYSKIGSYEGINNANGPFVYTGFKPSWLLCKDIDNTRNWVIIDNARDQINPTDKGLFPNDSAVEATGNNVDFLSNGFKIRTTGTSLNAASTYIFVAFAKHPFIGDGTNPCTAR